MQKRLATDRRLFLALFALLLTLWGVLAFVSWEALPPQDLRWLHGGFGAAAGVLGWLAMVPLTVLSLKDGRLSVGHGFGALHLPVDAIHSCRILRRGSDTLLEVHLSTVPVELKPYLNTGWKRRCVAKARHLRWTPPSEPFLLLSIPPIPHVGESLNAWLGLAGRASAPTD